MFVVSPCLKFFFFSKTNYLVGLSGLLLVRKGFSKTARVAFSAVIENKNSLFT
jgi:hypothetical protein